MDDDDLDVAREAEIAKRVISARRGHLSIAKTYTFIMGT